jgi:hypothetical protein
MTFIATCSALGATALSTFLGTGIVAGVGTGVLGLSAGAIAATGSALGGALGGAALGAGLGAGTAALTGGDVGKSALMGAGTGALGGGIAGGIAGAGGAGAVAAGSAGSVAGDTGVVGELGATGAEAITPGLSTPTGGFTGSTGLAGDAGNIGTQTSTALTPSFSSTANSALAPTVSNVGGYTGNAANIGQAGSGGITPAFASASQNAVPQMGLKGIDTSLTANAPVGNLGQAGQQGITAKAPDYFDKGIKLISDNPGAAMQVGGAALGLMGGTSGQQQDIPTSGGQVVTVSPDFQRTVPVARKPIPVRYAMGGITPSQSQPQVQAQQQPQAPMNKFVQMGMDEGLRLKQAQQPVQPTQPQQGIVPQQPTAPTQMQQPVRMAEGGVTPPANNGFMDQVKAATLAQIQLAQPQPQAQQPSVQQPTQPIQLAQPQPAAQPQQPVKMAEGGIAGYSLGGYAHGGIPNLLSGEGDGVSDSIPGHIGEGEKQPVRLASGEFIIPARIVSELGNGSTDAGAKALEAMMARVQKRRSKTVGKGKLAVDSKARKELLA